MNSNFNIAILFGGISSEREVSINSAMEIYDALPSFLNINLIELNHSNFSSFINELEAELLMDAPQGLLCFKMTAANWFCFNSVLSS